jgi:hypothetical protein
MPSVLRLENTLSQSYFHPVSCWIFREKVLQTPPLKRVQLHLSTTTEDFTSTSKKITLPSIRKISEIAGKTSPLGKLPTPNLRGLPPEKVLHLTFPTREYTSVFLSPMEKSSA